MQSIPDVTVEDLIALTLLIAIGFLLAVAFYESLSTRDVLVRQARRLAVRLSGRRWVRGMAYFVTVLVGIPLLILVWTVVLDTALFFLSPVEAEQSISLVAVSVVGAARILAYANERVAHELAKALPLALLFLLLTGGDPDLEAKMAGLDERNSVAPTETTLVFLVSLEVGLRILTDGSNESWPGPGVDEASTLTSASGVRGRLPSAWIMALATSRRQTAD